MSIPEILQEYIDLYEALKAEADFLRYSYAERLDGRVIGWYETPSFLVPWCFPAKPGKNPEGIARANLSRVRKALKKGRFRLEITGKWVHLSSYTEETRDKIIEFYYPLIFKEGSASQ